MKKYRVVDQPFVKHVLLAACVVVLVVMFVAGMPGLASAQSSPVPPVPANLEVPAGNKMFFVGHAVGTQNYICLPAVSGVRWTLFTPQATLVGEDDGQVATHYFSPNPGEAGTVRPTWQHSKDSSTVWARGMAGASTTDPAYVAPGAIAWLTLEVLHTQTGPKNGDRLVTTTFIQRLNTSGGAAPSTGCASLSDIGSMAFVPYEADYYFYKPTGK